MSNLTDRVSYIKGLAEGMKLDTDKNEGKIIEKVLELLSDMAEEMENLRRDHEELDEYVESIDSDLSDMEDALFGDEDEDDCCCGHCHHGDEDDEDDEDDGLITYTCAHCGKEMTFDADSLDLDEDYLCPYCHQPVYPETPDEE